MNPCMEYCKIRFGREYSKECDNLCDYAKAVKEKNDLVDRVLEITDDMCRDEETGYVISRKMVYVLASELIDRVLALKEGEQK